MQENAPAPMVVTPVGISNIVTLEQSRNAWLPIILSEFDNVIEATLLQPAKADSPTFVTEFGKIID